MVGSFVVIVVFLLLFHFCRTLNKSEGRKSRKKGKGCRKRRISAESLDKATPEELTVLSSTWKAAPITKSESGKKPAPVPVNVSATQTKSDLSFKGSKDPKFILDDNKREKFEELMEELMRQEETESHTDRLKRGSKVTSKSSLPEPKKLEPKEKLTPLDTPKVPKRQTSRGTTKKSATAIWTDLETAQESVRLDLAEEPETGQFATIEAKSFSDHYSLDPDENDSINPPSLYEEVSDSEAPASRLKKSQSKLGKQNKIVNKMKGSKSSKSFNKKSNKRQR
jgi:hypothetical protein